MSQKTFNTINGILNIFFGIAWFVLAYLALGKPLCGGGTVTFPWIIPFIIGGVGFIILGIIILRRIKK